MIKRILSMHLSWLRRRDWASGDRRLDVVYGFNARLGETPSCRLCYSNRMFDVGTGLPPFGYRPGSVPRVIPKVIH